MKCYNVIFSLALLLACCHAFAQKPFTEGVIIYNVRLEAENQKAIEGTYTFTFKGSMVRKELMLDNGYHDIELFNCSENTVYSLQSMNGKKYAIQLSMGEIQKAQEKFIGYSIHKEETINKQLAGCNALTGQLVYRDGAAAEIYYTRDWRPYYSITYERFPDAKFLPLIYSYKDANGMSMRFEAEKVTHGPVESAVFRIPDEYKMISNAEYRQMSR